jgi:hypothetical protein
MRAARRFVFVHGPIIGHFARRAIVQKSQIAIAGKYIVLVVRPLYRDVRHLPDCARVLRTGTVKDVAVDRGPSRSSIPQRADVPDDNG